MSSITYVAGPCFGVSARHPVPWTRSLALAMAWIVGVRLFITVYLAAAAVLFPHGEIIHWLYDATGVVVLDTGWEALVLGVWQREDAIWYEKIATVGYSLSDGTQDRFPLYPMAMKLLVALAGIHPVAAGIFVSELSLLASLFLLHRMVLPRFGEKVAGRALAYVSLFPMAFFLHGPFSESLMLLVALLTFRLVETNRWIGAVAVAYLAGLTRPQGILIGAPLALQWLSRGKPGLDWINSVRASVGWLPAGLIASGPLLGFATFAILVDTAWRGPFFAGGRGLWAQQSVTFPGGGLLHAVQRIIQGTVTPIDYFDFTVAILFVCLTIQAFRRLDVSWGLYSALFLLAPLSRFEPRFPLMSLSRYVLVLFPCFVLLALWGQHKWVHLTIIFVWLIGLAFWSAMFYVGAFVG